MKNKLLALAILSLMLVALAGCGGGETTVSAPPERSATEEKTAEEPAEPTSIDYDNRALASNDKVDVALKEISHDGITFTMTNKTADIITIRQEGIALDGQCIYAGDNALLYEDLVPNTSTEVLLPYELNNIKHQNISGSFELSYVDEQGYGSTDSFLNFSNVDLGYESHPIWEYPEDSSQNGQVLYEDARVTCRLYRIMDDMFAVTIKNNSTEFFTTLIDSIVVDGKSISETSTVGADCLPGCEAIDMIQTLDFDLESEIQSGSTIAGVVELFGQTGGINGQFSFNMTVE